MAVRRDLPVDNVADIVKLAKTKPGDLKFGSGGVGTSMHLTAVLFANRFGVEMQHIPFQGSAPALNSLMGGHIDILFDPVVTLTSQATSGAVKALAITGKSRSASLPEVPTVAESGAPGFDVEGWFALLAPANTPSGVTNVLHQQVVKALAGEDVSARLNTLGVRPIGSSPAEFAQYLRAEVDRWMRVVVDAKITEE
jgi:tripartite-type tricarboxylate transporter receptor subunit TctC